MIHRSSRHAGWSRIAFGFVLATVVVAILTRSSPSSAGESLSFEDRVVLQKAVEKVYWRHRVWPSENQSAKPPLDAFITDAETRAKVEDTLSKSDALATVWHRPITSAGLQAEMDRMARGSRNTALLGELFSALGNDPFLIAETLARPALADRLIRGYFRSDGRFEGDLESRIESKLSRVRSVRRLKSLGGIYSEAQWLKAGAADGSSQLTDSPDVMTLDSVEWGSFERDLARQLSVRPGSATAAAQLPVRRIGRLVDTGDAYSVTAILSRSGSSYRTASVTWRKPAFDAWWSGEKARHTGIADTPWFAYSPVQPAVGGCTDDTWSPTYQDLPDPRRLHSAVWTGTEMIVWGGYEDGEINSGGRYSPATDTWLPTSTAPGVPEERRSHSAVWTGSEMIVWGGSHGTGPSAQRNTGARYNPVTDTWVVIAQSAATPSARSQHTTVWTGTGMIVWGGTADGIQTLDSGGRYSPASDTWSATGRGANLPVPRQQHTAVWTGTEMIVWGGINTSGPLGTGGRYNPVTDGWSVVSTGANVPSGRSQHTAVWTGRDMIVWGGGDSGGVLATGGRYDPVTDSWVATSTGAGVPSQRSQHSALAIGSIMIIWGGQDASGASVATGAQYSLLTDTWRPTDAGPAVPAARHAHSVVWDGREMIVWGGENDTTYLDSGGRYDPLTDTWVPTSLGSGVPSARRTHTAVWTGAEMIVWGGRSSFSPQLDTGGRYDPALDTWTQTSLGSMLPEARQLHTAVWTGARMIVWGGYDIQTLTGGGYLQSGAQYNPVTDSWRTMGTGANVPGPRFGHTAVWTGAVMIVWGGNSLNTGGIYNPFTDVWRPMSSTNVPEGRSSHTAIWDGTEMVVWGGKTLTAGNTDSGGRYRLATDTWLPTSTRGSVPPGRAYHTAVWTGHEMIVWGGKLTNGVLLDSGARYDPLADTWAPLAAAGAPQARQVHSAVWTGDEMIVWGGAGILVSLGTGGRYDPVHDVWRPTSAGTNAPAARHIHSAVWTGDEMIVWGGSVFGSTALHTGARYCAATTACTPTLWYADSDNDSFGDATRTASACFQPIGYVAMAGDCNDLDSTVFPGAADSACNGIDNDCDASIDEDFFPSATACGAGACRRNGVATCVLGVFQDSCVPGLPSVEVCDLVDNDCDGSVDESLPVLPTTCGIGPCASTGLLSCVAGVLKDSCLPKSPATEVCDLVDNDCDGSVDEGLAIVPTACGIGACLSSGISTCVGGIISDSCLPGLPAPEVCNGIDDDCNGIVDILPPPVSPAGTTGYFSQLPAHPGGSLSLTERAAIELALQQVAWSRRIWPSAGVSGTASANPAGKPPLDTLLDAAALQSKTEDALRRSNALERLSGRAITASDLQEEMDRMARDTRDPEALASLFAALGNDPFLIAEGLARPILAGRRLRETYARDAMLHAATRARAEAAIMANGTVPGMTSMGGEYSRVRWSRDAGDPSQFVPAPAPQLGGTALQPPSIVLSDPEFTALSDRLAAEGLIDESGVPKLGTIEESDDAFTVTAVLSSTNGTIETATVAWRKTPFDGWWASVRSGFAPDLALPSNAYVPVTPAAGCISNSWRQISSGPNQPTPRYGHTAVWTGNEMIVWGGLSLLGYEATGAVYSPATDSWAPTATTGAAPSGRDGHSAVWTGTDMIVWGGFDGAAFVDTGARYRLVIDAWAPVSIGSNTPGARQNHTAVWTGSEMIVWGGYSTVGPTKTGGRYNPQFDSWLTVSKPGSPSPRWKHTAIWTGMRMVVWGGTDNSSYFQTGGQYDPVTDTWQPTSVLGAVPPVRAGHTAVWTGNAMIVWGGLSSTFLSTGGIYDPALDIWTPTNSGLGVVPSARERHTAIWASDKMVIWGGVGAAGVWLIPIGSRYDPLVDTWQPVPSVQYAPQGWGHTAVWTGSEMIIWSGGYGAAYCLAPCVQLTWYRDADHDAYGDVNTTFLSCLQPSGYVVDATDCNDLDPNANPGHLCDTTCNGIDDNCDGVVDDGCVPGP